MSDLRPDYRLVPVLGWAAFLACSWTWCIGMFLPALMVRDFGAWGWVVFAIPNVAGAAAMGWVLQRDGASERITTGHGSAVTVFSIITILFHVLFVGMLVPQLIGWAGPAVAIGVAVLTFWVARTWSRGRLVLAALVLAASIAAIAMMVRRGGAEAAFVPSKRELDLLCLMPVVIFGFLLCPYLDLTFHRARRFTAPIAAAAAFTIGFGLLFLAMIVFTLLYTPWLIDVRGIHAPPTVAWAVGLHMAIQSGFTVALHAGEVAERARAERSIGQDFGIRRGLWIGAIAGLATLAGGVALGYLPRYRQMYDHTNHFGPFEMGYRLFMAFYGLVFPAYVWLCIIPARFVRGWFGFGRWRSVLAATALAAPFYWMGFIESGRGSMLWLLPGLAIVLVMRWVPLEKWLRREKPKPADAATDMPAPTTSA